MRIAQIHTGTDIQGLCEKSRKRGSVLPNDGRPYAHDYFNPAQVCCCASDWLHKKKSAIHIARNYLGQSRYFTGQHFWVRGYHFSTMGRNEQVVRK